MITPPHRLREIVDLSREIGSPARQLAILAEGNISMRTAPNRMLVKATGVNLATADDDGFVEVALAEFNRMIDSDLVGDDAVDALFRRATRWGARRPSVESLLHAVFQRLDGTDTVVHTHPTAVNALLCSDQADLLTAGSLFPDQIVVMGTQPLLIPYVDPGLPLARYVVHALQSHIQTHGAAPKVVYLRNHGMFAIGTSAEDALGVTLMAVKSAQVLAGALAVGKPVFLSATEVARIDTRPDELLRRQLLSQ